MQVKQRPPRAVLPLASAIQQLPLDGPCDANCVPCLSLPFPSGAAQLEEADEDHHNEHIPNKQAKQGAG